MTAREAVAHLLREGRETGLPGAAGYLSPLALEDALAEVGEVHFEGEEGAAHWNVVYASGKVVAVATRRST